MNDETKTLDLVNEARAVRALTPLESLPQGYRHNATTCPLALALGGGYSIGPVNACKDATGEIDDVLRPLLTATDRWRAPVGRFVADFDAGSYPHLIAPPPPKRQQRKRRPPKPRRRRTRAL